MAGPRRTSRGTGAVDVLFTLAALVAAAAVVASLGLGGDATKTRAVRLPPEPLDQEARVRFGPIETALAKTALTGGDEVALTGTTQAALAGAMAGLPANASPLALKRIRWLIQRSFPGPAGTQLSELFAEYHRYWRAEQRLRGAWDETAEDLEAETARFEQLAALRRRHFGEARAERLFGREHALVRYHLALRRLETRTEITEAEKESRRRALQSEYERQPGASN